MPLVDERLNDPQHVKNVQALYEEMARNNPIMKGISEELKSLEKMEQDNIPTIKEHYFVHVFLPFFAGDEVNTYNVSEGNWMTIAGANIRGGAAYNRVNVINENNEVLFSVPPLFDNNAYIPVSHDHRNSAREILEELKHESTISPGAAIDNYRYRLANILASGNQDTNEASLKYIAEWNEIFKRYNRPLVEFTDNNGNKLTVTPEGKLKITGSKASREESLSSPGISEDDFEEI